MEFYPTDGELTYRKMYHSSNAFEGEDFDYYIKSIKHLYPPILNTGNTDQKKEGEVNENSKGITNRLTWTLNLNDIIFSSLKEKIINHINLANNLWKFDIINLLDVIYMEYTDKNSTFLDWHMDLHNNFPFCNRKISFTIPFNSPTEYEGGTLEFFTDSYNSPTFRPEINSIIAFPSFLMHKVTPITEGTRKVLVGFVGGPPLR